MRLTVGRQQTEVTPGRAGTHVLLEATWPEKREARLGAPACRGGVPHRWERSAHHRHREACQNHCGAWGQPPPNPAGGGAGGAEGDRPGASGAATEVARRSQRGVPKKREHAGGPAIPPSARAGTLAGGVAQGEQSARGPAPTGMAGERGRRRRGRGASRVAVGVQQTRTTLGRVQGSSRGVGRTCSGSHPARCATQEGGGPGAGEHSRSAGVGSPPQSS